MRDGGTGQAAATASRVGSGHSVAAVRWSVAVAAFAVGFNLSSMNLAVSDLSRDFAGTSFATIGWVVSAYTIVFGAVLVPAGRLADRVGRRRVFLAGLVIFGGGSAIAAVAPTVLLVVAGRVVQGIGAACITPSSLGLLLEVTPPTQRAAATSFFSGVSSIGSATGPSLGALLIDGGGWRMAFAISPVFAFVSWTVGRRALPRTAVAGATSLPDVFGALLLVVSMTALSTGIVQGRTWGWTDPRIVAAFLVAVGVLPVFVWRSAHHHSPVIALSLLRVRSFALANLAALLFGMSTGGIVLVNTFFLRNVWGYSLLGTGFGLIAGSLVAIAVAPFVGRLGNRYGARAVGVPGAVVIAAGPFFYRSVVELDSSYWTHWLPGALCTGAGIAATFPMIAVSAVRDVEVHDLSVASATNRTALQVGNAIGIALVVAIIGAVPTPDSLGDFRVAWTVLGVLALGCAALTATFRR